MSVSIAHQMITAIDQRLTDLAFAYDAAKATADEAYRRAEEIKTALKTELWARAPETTAAGNRAGDQQHATILLTVPGLPEFKLEAASKWSLDTTRLKTQLPETYARYAKRSVVWSLRH